MLANIGVVEGDITGQKVDAIVNTANNSLLGGGGIDGAIHRAAGPEFLEECCRIGGCLTGDARVTRDYCLPAKWVIHTVGPVWRGGANREDELLAACYQNSMALAELHQIRSIAVPSIGSGFYGLPLERAARIATREAIEFFREARCRERLVFVCFGQRAYNICRNVLDESR
jgi:O-acetyl-ADP-ribose deacetylase (regulator of RNase III)